MKKIDYAEILILGKCPCKCFYCLGHEMKKAAGYDHMGQHFSYWPFFQQFIHLCECEHIEKIYVSSVNTDPFVYKYINELIAYLNEHFRYVGIRGNAASLTPDVYPALDACTEEISISLNATDELLSKTIAGEKAKYEKYNLQFFLEREAEFGETIKSQAGRQDSKRSVRVAIVVNRYNVMQIPQMLDFLASYNAGREVVSYVQLRRVYKYFTGSRFNGGFDDDWVAYKILKEHFERTVPFDSSFHESKIYRWTSVAGLVAGTEDFPDPETRKNSVKVSFWDNVFSKDSIQSLNYFTAGKISDDTLLVPGFESK